MKGRIIILVVGLIVLSCNVYAANGDLTVNGNLSVGTSVPEGKLHVVGGIRFGGPFMANGSFANTAIVAENGWLRDAWLTSHSYANIRWDDVAKKWKRQVTGDQYSCWNYNDFGGLLFDGDRIHLIKGICGSTGEWTNTDFRNNFIKMTITAGGGVAIGATDSYGYKLYVAGSVYATGGYQPSDIAFKENVATIDSPLKKILDIRGVTFTWKAEEFKDKGFPEGRYYGVIAQEIEKVLPEIVKEGPEGKKVISYTEMIPVVIEAMKEQQKTIDKQQKEIEDLKVAIRQMRASISNTVASLKP